MIYTPIIKTVSDYVISGYGDIKDIANRNDVFIRVQTNSLGDWFYGYVIPSLFSKKDDYKMNDDYKYLSIFHVENQKDVMSDFVPLKTVAKYIKLSKYVNIDVSAHDTCSTYGYMQFDSKVKNEFIFTTETASNLHDMIKDISDLTMVTNINSDDKHFTITCTKLNNTRSYSLDINKFANYVVSDMPVAIVPTYVSKNLIKSLKNAKIDDIFKYILIENNNSKGGRSFVLVLYFYDANKNEKSVAVDMNDCECFKKSFDALLSAKNPHMLQF